MTARDAIRFLDLAGARLEYLDIAASDAARPPVLLLHEGLGSVSMWRDFPAALARATGSRVVAYSRAGFGRSSPRATPCTKRFVHEEAQEVLPALRERLALVDALLVGHSTGASMALAHAAFDRDGVSAVVAMAPLVDVEAGNLESIRAARDRYETTDWRDRLARHHDDPNAVFRAWNDTWLDPGFRDWSLAADLAAIRCPVLAIGGLEDPYSTPSQLAAIRARAANARWVEVIELPGCGHAPHRERPAEVLQAVARLAASALRDDGPARFER